MGFVLTALVFCGGGLLVCLAFGRDFGQGLPVFVLGATVCLYGFALAGALGAGVWVVCLLGAAGFALLGLRAAKAKSAKPVLDILKSPSIYAFFGILLLIFIINQNRNFTWTDEFSFWGLAVKEQVRLGGLYNLPGSAVTTHRDYPPAIMLFQTFWCKLAGGYSEVSCYRALQFFTLSFFLPAFSAAKGAGWRRWATAAGLFATAVVLHTTTGVNLYASIYVDATMGVLIGYVFSLVVTEEVPSPFGITALALGSAVAVLAKRMGVFLLAFVAIYLLARTIGALRRNHTAPERQTPAALLRPPLLALGVSVAGALAAQLSWKLYLTAVGAAAPTFDVAPITPASALTVLAGGGDARQALILRNFSATVVGDALFATPLFSGSFLQMALLVTLVAALLAWRYRHGPHCYQARALAVTLPPALAVYAAAMLMLYLFSFNAEEGAALASFTRYMGTGLVAATTALFLAGAAFFTAPEVAHAGAKPLPWPAIAVAVMVFFTSASTYLSFLPQRREDNHFSHMAAPAAQLSQQLDPVTDRLLVAVSDVRAAEYIALRYYAAPILVERLENNAYLTQYMVDNYYYYVYIDDFDPKALALVEPVLAPGSEAEADSLYRLEATEDGPKLTYVATLEVDRGEGDAPPG